MGKRASPPTASPLVPVGLPPAWPGDARAHVEQGKERQGREGEEKRPSASMETTLPGKLPGWQPKGCGADITKTSTARDCRWSAGFPHLPTSEKRALPEK